LPAVEVIKLLRRDTPDIVCELLHDAAPGTQVWLVAPWRMRLARSLVDLKLLQRTADIAALDLRLVSHDLQARTLAHQASIPVYGSLPGKLRRYTRARRPPPRGLDGRVVSYEGRLSRRWRRRPHKLNFGTVLLSLVVIFALAVALLGAAVVLVPNATVHLAPIAQPVSGSLEVTANPEYREIDYGQAIIPARVAQVILSGRGETPATGRIDVPDGHSAGEVVFVNKTTNAVLVPKGTMVRTGSGVNLRFYTVDDLQLPAALYSSGRVGVIAFEAGPVSNVQALTISVVEGAVAHLVNVLNDQPTRGGSIKRAATVAYNDVDKLRTDLIQRLQQEAYAQLVGELHEGEFIPRNSVDAQVMAENFDQVLEQQSDVLSMEMKVVVRGLAVDSKSFEALARHFLESKGTGLGLIEDSLTVRRSEEVLMVGNGARFSISAQGVVAPVINEDDVKAALRGRDLATATSWLSEHLQLQAEPEISIFPQQWERMPWLTGRINVVISASGQPTAEHFTLGKT